MNTYMNWEKIFNEVPPVGFMLRETYPEKWIRIHSLPGAKRYPETDEEVKELQKRYIEVAKKVLGCDLISCFVGVYGQSRDEFSIKNEWAKELSLKRVKSYNLSEGNSDDLSFLNIYEGQCLLKNSFFNSIIMDVSNENIDGSVVFFNQKTGNVFAPYDGGMDLFISGRLGLIDVKKTFPDWLSNRDDGL